MYNILIFWFFLSFLFLRKLETKKCMTSCSSLQNDCLQQSCRERTKRNYKKYSKFLIMFSISKAKKNIDYWEPRLRNHPLNFRYFFISCSENYEKSYNTRFWMNNNIEHLSTFFSNPNKENQSKKNEFSEWLGMLWCKEKNFEKISRFSDS